MLKNQKDFSPLECSLCREKDSCTYGQNYEAMYRYGYRMKVTLCKRLQAEKTEVKR